MCIKRQALEYAEILDIPFVFSSNGDGFLFHDRTGLSSKRETELPLNGFPSPETLWERYCASKNIANDKLPLVTQDYHTDISGKTPRYYQWIAINRTLEAIAGGQDRILLVMTTGTGKTYTAFQIIWRLWKARIKKRILFLADRNILVDQTRINDFKPFGSAMTKIRNRQVDKSFEIYLALYQAVSGTEEFRNIYKQFSPDFFDLVIIDECHRGSAAEDSAWREILEYFYSAVQIGMTATPKETAYVSNIRYFGDPVYTYSLRQGIEDGFLAPYRVIRINLDKDLTGWRPEKEKLDKYGHEIEDRIYNQKDYDRQLVLEKRTSLVAKKISQFLKATDRMAKTIVFCEDIDHAERMRQALVNENPDMTAADSRYVMRMTGDSAEGKLELDNFIMPESDYPVIVTTSRLLSTGVDVQTCKLIVLDRIINSMTEFKQIIGRGTRVNEYYDKYFFTIMDFKKATELFADPEFDGDPVQIYQPGSEDPSYPPDLAPDQDSENPDDDGTLPMDPFGDEGSGGRVKYYVHDVEVSVVAERVQCYGKDGRLITESIKDYTKKTVKKDYSSMDVFLKRWSSAERKKAVIEELEEEGVLFEPLADAVGKDFDPFDLICHVVYGQPPLTRRERAARVRKTGYFARYGKTAKKVLEVLVEKYADEGIENIEDINVLRLNPINEIGTPMEIIDSFGGREHYMDAVRELEEHIYSAA
jgi:type I restriction enzyme, R subunit